jgi:hypothetical protein
MADCSQLISAIPGPNDAPLNTFLRVALNVENIFSHILIAHAHPVLDGEIAINGIGGYITEDEDTSQPVIKYAHASAEYFLRNLWRVDKPIKILMLSEPPTGILGGDKGNPIVNEFLKSYHPTVCVVMGQTKHRGSAGEYPHSLVINPGMISEGSAAYLDTVTREVEMLDF